MSFSERRKIYFPVESKGLAKVWKCLVEPPGYISIYQNQRRRLAPESRETLDDCLGELLGLCQCLPDSSRAKSGGWIWSVKQKKIVVLTNPSFYQIKKIGKKPSNRGKNVARSAPAHRSMKSTAIAMMEQAQVPREVAEKAYRLSKRYKARADLRSAKSKNKRRPPQKKRKEDDRDDEGEDDSECQGKRHRQKKRKREESTEGEEEIQKPLQKKKKRVEDEDEEDEIEDCDDDWYEDTDRWDRANEGDDEEDNDRWERDSMEDDVEE
jgi:hypothetical protein